MINLQAKFKVGSVENFGNNNVKANLSAVVSGSEENKTFSMYTPSASMSMLINNPNALDFFEAGEEYIATFTKFEKRPVDMEMYMGKVNQ